MAEAEVASPVPQFLEVKCKSSGKIRRFAPGTEAGFAVSVINRKLGVEHPLALHIEAVKEGEEPVAFGPNSVLAALGEGWNLETVAADVEFSGAEHSGDVVRDRLVPKRAPFVDVPRPVEIANEDRKSSIGLFYIGKIILAFVLLFMLGATFTFALENLPLLISFTQSQLAFK